MNDGANNLPFLGRRAHLELLLQEDGRLLIIVRNDLVDEMAPIAVCISVQEAAIINWLSERNVRGLVDCLVSVRSDSQKVKLVHTPEHSTE
jgi:hypothetical protein